jgi:hypothetical protein
MVEASSVTASALTVVTLLVLGFIIYELYQYYESGSSSGGSGTPTGPKVSVPIIGEYSAKNGRRAVTFSNSKLPKSTDQPSGIEFSYAFWMRVDEWGSNRDAESIVFIKGVPGGGGPQCPYVSVYDADDPSNPNVLNVAVDTFRGVEKIKMHNMPSNKFFHVIVRVTDSRLKVYVDGLLKETRTLDSVPRQNSSNLFVAPGKGFEGEIGSLTYYNYALSTSEIAQIANTPPVETVTGGAVLPPYQDQKWWWKN